MYGTRSDGEGSLVILCVDANVEGQRPQDWNLLGAAAHLLQDASCPAHWFPTKRVYGRIIGPYVPTWVDSKEDQVNFSWRKEPTTHDSDISISQSRESQPTHFASDSSHGRNQRHNLLLHQRRPGRLTKYPAVPDFSVYAMAHRCFSSNIFNSRTA